MILQCFFFFRFQDKTLNDWKDRDLFAKQAGKYDLLKMDYKATVSCRSHDGHVTVM